LPFSIDDNNMVRTQRDASLDEKCDSKLLGSLVDELVDAKILEHPGAASHFDPHAPHKAVSLDLHLHARAATNERRADASQRRFGGCVLALRGFALVAVGLGWR